MPNQNKYPKRPEVTWQCQLASLERLEYLENRLAALEKVCGEIVESASLEKNSSSFSTAFLKGSEVAERHIAQKLKSVLEEA